jgi:hypothetical protein
MVVLSLSLMLFTLTQLILKTLNTIVVVRKSPTFLKEKTLRSKDIRSVRQSREGAVQKEVSTFFNSNNPNRPERIVKVLRASDQSIVLI